MNAVENALVSVILQVYNAEKQLRTCMESVLRQTYSNLEFIVIDDGSTDQSAAVARSFQDARVTVIETEHRGVSRARNTGLKNMTGQYFTFVDADDFVADTYVEVIRRPTAEALLVNPVAPMMELFRYMFLGLEQISVIGLVWSVVFTVVA